MRFRYLFPILTAVLAGASIAQQPSASAKKPVGHADAVDTTSVRGKIMCGYQGWFRCPGDAANRGWSHWSRNSQRIAPDLLTFEMWPDLTDYPAAERYPAPGFAYP